MSINSAKLPINIRDKFKNFMKKVLDYERSRNSSDPEGLVSFKNIVVDLAYNELDKLFYELENLGKIKPCSCKHNISNRKASYYNKDCECNGTGYLDN